jgi:DNA polymerase III sliding clamp (beta) subunit (PCNA family)
VDLPAGQLRGALRRAGITANTETRGVKFAFDTGTLTLSAAVADVGTTECNIPVTCLCDPTTVTLDVDFMAEAMADLAPDALVTLYFLNSESAVVLTTGPEWTYVVMPLMSS